MPQLPYIPVSIFTQTDGFLGFILPTRAFAGDFELNETTM